MVGDPGGTTRLVIPMRLTGAALLGLLAALALGSCGGNSEAIGTGTGTVSLTGVSRPARKTTAPPAVTEAATVTETAAVTETVTVIEPAVAPVDTAPADTAPDDTVPAVTETVTVTETAPAATTSAPAVETVTSTVTVTSTEGVNPAA